MTFVRMTKRRWFSVDESGSGLVEFALSSVVLLMVIFGILDCSRALYTDHYVANAAREATRYAMVRGSSWSGNGVACSTPSTFSCTATSANINSFVTSITPAGFTASNLTVTSLWTGLTPSGAPCTANGVTNSPGCVVNVKVSYSFNFILPFLPQNALVLKSTSAVAIVQ